jgi:hypothetical protein
VQEASPSVLSAWANFYVITGSSAAALTGLMFANPDDAAVKPAPSENPDGSICAQQRGPA